ncbi:MAG TPA: carboxypeptidase regulatory-like domain-containing protein [Acidobacteriaceae bacterium]|nr:carboxypeptidase regulatory-like domain-containing protein [Acidobacteriaceae bacterium]
MRSFPRIRPAAALVMLLVAGLLLWQSPVMAQETTGSVSGIVQDSTGAAIPHASVVLMNLSNKTERRTVSNGTGEFTIPSVPSDVRYQVKVSMQGFKAWESKPFPVRPGDRIAFSDIKLQIGEATAEVTVEATESQAVKPLDTPERSDVITSKDLETLAIVGRDATELIETLPGFSVISPGVNNQTSANTAAVGINNNITGGYSSNGAGPTGLATVLDGVSLTDIGSRTNTVQTVNADMIESAKVSTSTFSAVNAQGPSIFNATTKHGTSTYHGELYFYARNTAMNSNDWDNNYLQQTRPDGSYYYPGGTIGGPLWIPGTRFGRSNNKLFFFFGLEYLNQKFSPTTLDSWVPTLAERTGDFSVANLNAQLCGARPDGLLNPNAIQPMCYAENYLANGNMVADGNVKPFANAGGVALVNWLPLPNADPFHNVSGYNYIQPVVVNQNGDILHARVDYAINDRNSVYAAYGRQSQITDQPVNLNYIPSNSVLYPGGITTGDISNIASLTYTHTFSSSVTNEVEAAISFYSQPGNMGNPAAVSRFSMNSYNGGNGNFNYLGEYKNAGDYSVPALQDYSNLGYPNLLMPGGFYNNQIHLKKVVPDVQEVLSWTKGAHFFQFGVYAEKGIINGTAVGGYPQGMYTFNPGNSFYEYNSNPQAPFTNAQFIACQNPQTTGTSRLSGAAYLGSCINPVAMMYLGTPDSFTQTNFTPIADMQYNTVAGFVNDQWKIHAKALHEFTVMLGARIEHLGPWTDKHNNGLATFSPSLYKQQCTEAIGSPVSCQATTDYPGIVWHGTQSSISNSVNSPQSIYFSPRVGMAWDIFGHGNTVLHGGWGEYRHQEEFAPYAAAAATAQGFKTTYLQQQWNFDGVDEQSPVNPSDFNIDVVSTTDTERPIIYQYNGTISQRINTTHLRGAFANSLVEVAYVGTKMQHLSSFNQGSSYNEASDLNLIPGGYMFGDQTTNGFCLCNLPGKLSAVSIGSLTTAGQDWFRPYPFYQHIYMLNHNFYGNYNGLQTSWNKSTGLVTFGVNYTFSKTLATAASYNNQIVDPVNLRNDYNPAPYDRTHVVNAHYQVDLGKRYKGDSTLMKEVANGWLISGISSWQSGVDLPSAQGQNFGFGYGSLQVVQVATKQQAVSTSYQQVCENEYNIPRDKNGNQFCVTNMDPTTWLGTPDYQLMPTLNCNPATGGKSKQYINPLCFGVPMPGGPTTGPFAGVTTNPTGQGAYRLPYIHGPAYQNHNLSLYKNFGIEGRTLQLHASAFNFLNHPLTSFNNNDNTNLNMGNLNFAVAGQPLTPTQLRAPDFGIANIKYGSRLMELGAKFTF